MIPASPTRSSKEKRRRYVITSMSKISHVSEKVVDNIISLLKEDFQIIFEDGSGSMQVRRGDTHVYVGMTLDYSHRGQV
jgi:hypothetical protein